MSIKINTNRPFLKREDITDRRNFQEILLNHKKLTGPFYQSPKFYGWVSIAAVIVVVLIFWFSGRNSSSMRAFIDPPLKDVTITPTSFHVEAEAGGVINYSSGSVINIPDHAFVDENRNIVSGKVDIRYREFHDGVDFFLSGIPMTYDSGGEKYTFQSAGMLEIFAFQNSKQVFMNPDRKVFISLASKRDGSQYNVYELDTVKRNWVIRGKDIVRNQPSQSSDTLKTGTQDSASYAFADIAKTVPDPVMQKIVKEVASIKKEIAITEKSRPVEPKKVGRNRPRFTLEVDAKEFPEIAIYKNILFEVGTENKNFDPQSYKVTWKDAQLEEFKTGESYRLTLKYGERVISYIVYPVFEGKNFDEAVKEYNKKFAEYRKTLDTRKAEEKRKEEELALQMQRFEEQQRKIQREYEEVQKQQTAMLNQEGAVGYSAVRREFEIARFGIWNCDNPYRFENAARFQASFKDQNGNDLHVQQAYLIDKKKNLFSTQYFPFENFVYDSNSENILFVVLPDYRIAVFTSDQFRKINPKSGEYIFEMKVADAEFKSVADIKRYIGV